MTELMPLFPLNTVLFPGMPLSLHIFEERYKLMIGRCVVDKSPFGVVLLREGHAEYHPDEDIVPHAVGCSAVITQVQPVGLGRMNILAVGGDRFHVTSFDTSLPYLRAVTEPLPFERDPDSGTRAAALTLYGLVETYAKLLARAENAELEAFRLPDEPLELAFIAASLLKTDSETKQTLLELSSESTLLSALTRLYRKEAALMSMLLERPKVDIGEPFSAN